MVQKDGMCAFHASNVSVEEHRAFRVKCAQLGLAQSDIIRALVKGWVLGALSVPVTPDSEKPAASEAVPETRADTPLATRTMDTVV